MAELTKRELGRERCKLCGTWHEHFRLTPAGTLELKCELCERWHPHADVARHHINAGWGISFIDPRRRSTLDPRAMGSRIGDNSVQRVRFPRTREVQACARCRYAKDELPKALGGGTTDMLPRLVKKGRYE